MDVADGFRIHPDSGGLEDRMQQKSTIRELEIVAFPYSWLA